MFCAAFSPPRSAQPSTSTVRNDCRKVHLITSKLHLNFIFISHLASSSFFYSNFSIHHLFFSLQSSLLFLIYAAFSPCEFCSGRAHVEKWYWCTLWMQVILHPSRPSRHQIKAFSAQPPPMAVTIQVPLEHKCISTRLACISMPKLLHLLPAALA